MNAPPEKLGSFYLGGLYDLKTRQISEIPVNYDARDLTTHAICLGMTGSGKTGLCVGLLEEAALDKVPAFMASSYISSWVKENKVKILNHKRIISEVLYCQNLG